VLRVRFSHEKTFQVTPLDYLVIILIVLVPHLPEMHIENEFIGEMAIKLVVLFYACEAVMGLSASKWNLMRIGAISTLLLVAYRGF
jgi:UDP-GlcNAc:undecaprenyl-phosphate GlcNAc-1-phosphate transferase